MTLNTATRHITYRAMTENDLTRAYELSQQVKWPHRIEDWQLVHHLGTGFVAEQQGQVIGTALCWSHGEAFSSLGMVIVSPDHQGNGIGRKLMTQVLEAIGDNKNALLFATPSGQPLYESFGFTACGKVHQHQAIVTKVSAIALPIGALIRPLDSQDHNPIAQLAEAACGLARAASLNELLKSAQGIVTEQDGKITGFALMREFGRGYAIGPVISATPELAKSMIQYWLAAHLNGFIRIDVPASSGLSPWLASMGLAQVDTVVEMVRGNAPIKDQKMRQFALINQALG